MLFVFSIGGKYSSGVNCTIIIADTLESAIDMLKEDNKGYDLQNPKDFNGSGLWYHLDYSGDMIEGIKHHIVE